MTFALKPIIGSFLCIQILLAVILLFVIPSKENSVSSVEANSFLMFWTKSVEHKHLAKGLYYGALNLEAIVLH